ncbi:hypothetical protein ACEQ8H_001370 [Pleosporales sp. CAS-2024a]
MFRTILAFLLTLHVLVGATPHPVDKRNQRITFTSVGKTENSTVGAGNVAAAGNLIPFGNIGIGCGINWATNVATYGGGLQAGSSDFGLGSGFSVTDGKIHIGAGIGFGSAGASANLDFTGLKNGAVTLVFNSSKPIICLPQPPHNVQGGGGYAVLCKTM